MIMYCMLLGFVNLLAKTNSNFWGATTTDGSTMFCRENRLFGLSRNFRVI